MAALRRLPKTDPFIKADSNLIHYRQLHAHGANGSSPDHNKRALEYISTGQVSVKDLTCHCESYVALTSAHHLDDLARDLVAGPTPATIAT